MLFICKKFYIVSSVSFLEIIYEDTTKDSVNRIFIPLFTEALSKNVSVS